MSLLLRNAIVDGRPGSVRADGDIITGLGGDLERRAGEVVVDAGGGAVIPGLHDHHIHLRALAAARSSVDVSAAGSADEFDGLVRAHASGDRWLRVTGWHEERAGGLDRRRLDTLVGPRPVRVQHRTGALWVLDSAAVTLVGADSSDEPGIERDADGRATGKLWRADGWLRERIGDGDHDAALASVSREALRAGVVGFTDATPGQGPDDLAGWIRLSDAGIIRQRVTMLALPQVVQPTHARVAAGGRKIVLDDREMPAFADLCEWIVEAHCASRPVAVHCVTADQLVVTLGALESVGALDGDRIEHASVVPPGFGERMNRLGVTVVTQPGFIATRGDDYLRDVPVEEQPWLYPCASLIRDGVGVAGGTDAPYGSADPWQSVAAAVARRTASGERLGAAERLTPGAALALYLGRAEHPSRQRRIAVGEPADLCVLTGPLEDALAHPDAARVRGTVIAGEIEHWDEPC